MERVAFLSLDNLSGDDSLSWMREAVPAMAVAQLAGVGRTLPLRADTSRDAAAIDANSLIHGYFDVRGGKLHFEFLVEDAITHKMRPVRIDATPLQAADAIARDVEAGANPFSSQNPAAIQAWGEQQFEKATQLDPDFGAAWRDLIQSKSGQPAEAAELAGRALARSTLRSPLERAQIALLFGQLRRDEAAIRAASASLIDLVPNDGALARRLAEEANNARHFASAVELYQKVLRLEPGDFSIYNFLGYAQFFAGDLAGARQSFDEYARHPGQEANGLDSQGEVLFMAGQFGEAETYFLKAHQANPGLLEGGDLQKAAYSRWLAGDLKAADEIFYQYMKYRTEHTDQTEEWRRAGWEYATGRGAAALARLKAVSGPTAGMAQAQLQVLENRDKVIEGLSRDLPTLELSYLRTPAASDGLVRVLYAWGLNRAGRKTEAERVLRLWPLPESGDPALQPLLYPLYLELKEELGK